MPDLSMTEGWTWVQGSPKWHYFREQTSLCGRWLLFKVPSGGYQAGNDGSSDNCKACCKKLTKEREATDA